MGSSWTRDRTCASCIGRRILYHWATRDAPPPSLYTCLQSHMLCSALTPTTVLCGTPLLLFFLLKLLHWQRSYCAEQTLWRFFLELIFYMGQCGRLCRFFHVRSSDWRESQPLGHGAFGFVKFSTKLRVSLKHSPLHLFLVFQRLLWKHTYVFPHCSTRIIASSGVGHTHCHRLSSY